MRGQALEKAKENVEALTAGLAALEEPQAPPLPFILAEDPTLEGLQKSLLQGQVSQGLFSDEGGLFFGGYAGKPENMLKSASGLSSLWDGAPITRIRAAEGESASRAGCRLSAHLMIQPVVAREVLANPILQGQGFLARFLVAWPPSLAGTRLYRDLDPDEDVRIDRYWQRMEELLARTPTLDERGGLAPQALTMEPQALSTWVAVHDRIETRLGRSGELQEIKPMAAKGAENLLRIAGVMAVVEELAVITCELVERAAELMKWYLGEALRVGGAGQDESRMLQAQQLLDWLRANDWQCFEARRLQREGPRFVRKSARLRDELLCILLEHRQLLRPDGRLYVCPPWRQRRHRRPTRHRASLAVAKPWRRMATPTARPTSCRHLSPAHRKTESPSRCGVSPESPLSPRLTPPRGDEPFRTAGSPVGILRFEGLRLAIPQPNGYLTGHQRSCKITHCRLRQAGGLL